MVAIDTLVHNFPARIGTLEEYHCSHNYGLVRHTPKGCLGVIEELVRGLTVGNTAPIIRPIPLG